MAWAFTTFVFDLSRVDKEGWAKIALFDGFATTKASVYRGLAYSTIKYSDSSYIAMVFLSSSFNERRFFFCFFCLRSQTGRMTGLPWVTWWRYASCHFISNTSCIIYTTWSSCSIYRLNLGAAYVPVLKQWSLNIYKYTILFRRLVQASY